MATEDSIPTNDYTALAVQLGVIQEGQRNTLQGIEEIKTTLNKHGDRLGNVESRVAVVVTRVDAHDVLLQDAKPAKGRWANWTSAGAGIAAILIVILDRFYLPAAH